MVPSEGMLKPHGDNVCEGDRSIRGTLSSKCILGRLGSRIYCRRPVMERGAVGSVIVAH